jgi:predicted  nucleic acid-binding Zn-ribbon protein
MNNTILLALCAISIIGVVGFIFFLTWREIARREARLMRGLGVLEERLTRVNEVRERVDFLSSLFQTLDEEVKSIDNAVENHEVEIQALKREKAAERDAKSLTYANTASTMKAIAGRHRDLHEGIDVECREHLELLCRHLNIYIAPVRDRYEVREIPGAAQAQVNS